MTPTQLIVTILIAVCGSTIALICKTNDIIRNATQPTHQHVDRKRDFRGSRRRH